MPLSPGTYMIHETDGDRALVHYTNFNRIGTWKAACEDFQKWHIKRYPDGSGYAIQNVLKKNYIPTKMDGSNMPGVGEDKAATLSLEHQFQNFYLIKLNGTKLYVDHPSTKPRSDENYTPVSFTKDVPKDCFWRFERIGDDTGSALKPKTNNPTSIPSTIPSVSILSQDSSSQYTNDAHFHTDMLFNMPRTPFTRTQRMAALEWARKLGATNVPTMESFEECERRWEATLKGK